MVFNTQKDVRIEERFLDPFPSVAPLSSGFFDWTKDLKPHGRQFLRTFFFCSRLAVQDVPVGGFSRFGQMIGIRSSGFFFLPHSGLIVCSLFMYLCPP